jgi:antitoxin MazE
MRTRVQKWGNSLAVRIPKALALGVSLEQDTEVELEIQAGRLVVRKVIPREYSLDELLDEVTPGNLHGETETGAPVGREEW